MAVTLLRTMHRMPSSGDLSMMWRPGARAGLGCFDCGFMIDGYGHT